MFHSLVLSFFPSFLSLFHLFIASFFSSSLFFLPSFLLFSFLQFFFLSFFLSLVSGVINAYGRNPGSSWDFENTGFLLFFFFSLQISPLITPLFFSFSFSFYRSFSSAFFTFSCVSRCSIQPLWYAVPFFLPCNLLLLLLPSYFLFHLSIYLSISLSLYLSPDQNVHDIQFRFVGFNSTPSPKQGDTITVELDLRSSKPAERKVFWFVNGMQEKCSFTHLPPRVRFAFMLKGKGDTLLFNSIHTFASPSYQLKGPLIQHPFQLQLAPTPIKDHFFIFPKADGLRKKGTVFTNSTPGLQRNFISGKPLSKVCDLQSSFFFIIIICYYLLFFFIYFFLFFSEL